MGDRGRQAIETLGAQIDELVGLLSPRPQGALRQPCPGRQKLGDGTVGAAAAHTAGNYRRIASFLEASVAGRQTDVVGQQHDLHLIGDVRLEELLAELGATRQALRAFDGLRDDQLERVPAASDMRFVDGRRTVGEIVAGLLRHQQHQLEAIRAALT